MFSTKAGATRLLIGVVVGLIVFKVVVGLLTHSISIVAQAADSLLDLFAGIITFSAIRFAAKPADAEHQYGHGKAEDIADKYCDGHLRFTSRYNIEFLTPDKKNVEPIIDADEENGPSGWGNGKLHFEYCPYAGLGPLP
jgi:dissimilatory sulfite reductase (desulfoviridin) alpha/beta subunit